MKRCISLFVCALATGFSSQFTIADLIFADSDFSDTDWNVATIFQQSSSHQSQQVASGGNPGEFRQTTHTLDPDVSQERIAVLYHGFVADSYNPSIQGAISAIDYSFDRVVINPPFAGAQIGHRPAILQNGTVFTTISGPLNFANTSWGSDSQLNLTANDFVDATSLAQFGGDGTHFNPDFSGAGGVIQFGYLSGNTSPASALTIVTNHGIDNWRFSISSIPEPSSATVIGLVLLSYFVNHRLRRSPGN